ncbi:unnamed protein product [Ectocarpus sp. CCAP 1310/34]|nr:unnamed protein product [Ectocarpus sp. CCAP 1310/34]
MMALVGCSFSLYRRRHILTALQTAALCPASCLFHAYHGVFVQTALQTALCCSRQSSVLV